jgi:hypothetical protein
LQTRQNAGSAIFPTGGEEIIDRGKRFCDAELDL